MFLVVPAPNQVKDLAPYARFKATEPSDTRTL